MAERTGRRPQQSRLPVHAALAESLAALGVDTIFGLIGSGNFRLVEHLTAGCGVRYR